MNVKNSHWVAIVLDFDESCILYGDSLGGEPDDHLKNVLSWWTHLHTGRNFVWGKLDITIQQDGFRVDYYHGTHWFIGFSQKSTRSSKRMKSTMGG
jgi:hypothetical protein